MGRLLLLLPTQTYRAHDFMEAAGALDVDVAVGSDRRQALADLTPGKTLALDFLTPDAAVRDILAFAETYPLDAILGVDDDSVLLAAMASEALGLPHNSTASVRASRYKHVMRQMLADTGLPSPGFRLFSIQDDPAAAARSVRFPCVLKPVSLSASRGVIRADSPEAFTGAFRRIVALLSQPGVAAVAGEAADQLLVEDYIPGEEVVLEGLLVGGALTVLALFDKPDPLEGPYFEETLYVTPSRLPADRQAAIRNTTVEAARTLGLREGPVHAELRFNDAGVWIVEVAARSIGGLCSRILRFGAGISLEELILRQAVGLDLGPMQRVGRAAGVMMLPVPKKGMLRSVCGADVAKRVAGIQDVVITIPLDQEVEPLPEGSRYLGFIFAHADRPEEVEAALREAYRRLAVVIEA